MRVYWMRYVNVLKSPLESVSDLLLVGSYSFPIQYPRKSTIKSSFRKSPKLLAACLKRIEVYRAIEDPRTSCTKDTAGSVSCRR
jgi:hypothetical protein